MAIALVTSVLTEGSSGNTTSTTSSLDTTGATLLVMCGIWHQGSGPTITVSDSKSNSWTALTKYNDGNRVVQFWYCVPTSVGTGHTFTINGAGAQIYSNIGALAFSGTHASSPYTSQESGAGGTATTRQPGSLTPSENGCVLVTGFNSASIGGNSINSGFATALSVAGGGTQSGGLSYKIQTSAGAENPTWTNGGISGSNVANMAVFKAAAGGGGGGTTQEEFARFQPQPRPKFRRPQLPIDFAPNLAGPSAAGGCELLLENGQEILTETGGGMLGLEGCVVADAAPPGSVLLLPARMRQAVPYQ